MIQTENVKIVRMKSVAYSRDDIQVNFKIPGGSTHSFVWRPKAYAPMEFADLARERVNYWALHQCSPAEVEQIIGEIVHAYALYITTPEKMP